MKIIELGKVMECKHCKRKHPLYANGTICFMTYLYIWERDLLEMARGNRGWRVRANELGFSDEKINQPWTFPDAGRRIAYGRFS